MVIINKENNFPFEMWKLYYTVVSGKKMWEWQHLKNILKSETLSCSEPIGL